jgi:hypothetical protein
MNIAAQRLELAQQKAEQTTKTNKDTLIRQATEAFEAVKGRDGYVSPADWAKLRTVWLQQGGTLKDFIDNFSFYQNPHDNYY